MFKKRNILQTLAVFLFLVTLFFIFTSPTKPWEASGRLVVTVQTVPGSVEETILGLGIDNVELYKSDGSKIKVTVRTRRITLDPQQSNTILMLDETVPKGAYTGFGFTLKSPELRNNWENDEAPTHVSLLNEVVILSSSSFHIEENQTSALVLAFETLQAIHEDGEAKVYLPVIQVETRVNTAIVMIDEQQATIQGGLIESNATYGMDWDGLMRFNFRAQTKQSSVPEVVQENVLEEIPDTEDILESIATSSKDENVSTTSEES